MSFKWMLPNPEERREWTPSECEQGRSAREVFNAGHSWAK